MDKPFDIVVFTLDDGREVATPQMRRSTGHADTPLAGAELWGKFLGCTEHAGVPREQAHALFEAAQRIDTLAGAHEIGLPA